MINARYGGIASDTSSNSISLMALNKRPPTKINAGAVAQDGMMLTNGAKMIAAKNMIAVNTEVSPVLPPTLIPEIHSP